MTGKIILFHETTICIRGSTRALFDYAHYNEVILKNKSLIVFNKDYEDNDIDVISVFKKRFTNVFEYAEGDFHTLVPKICSENNVDFLYIIKDGHDDGEVIDTVRCGIHVMFSVFEPHGDIYAYVSKQEALLASYGYFPYVPHIVELPKPKRSLRSELGIPDNAFVLGRHGGSSTFDIQFVKDEIQNIVSKVPDIYFILVNADRFCSHNRIIFLDRIVDVQEKANFIGTCDAMLHARLRGESFGLAICEFLYLDKPVICWSGGYDKNHIELMKNDRELIYHDASSLLTAINSARFNKRLDGYFHSIVNEFSPENVMFQFEKVFLKTVSRRSFIGMLSEKFRLLELNGRHLFYRFRKRIGAI